MCVVYGTDGSAINLNVFDLDTVARESDVTQDWGAKVLTEEERTTSNLTNVPRPPSEALLDDVSVAQIESSEVQDPTSSLERIGRRSSTSSTVLRALCFAYGLEILAGDIN